ncbi:Capsule biosynthesis protein CapA [Enhygromyxa salina]|uniref:Capsule biosynthesis protein CapA n=1 Tax=Enhygromyxa salina TaxID=215803 RepID=A0A2S9XHD5_9BACT|nr:CapA family protein [Enhygromyxa salina]PRP92294.1 Capsule biosynthesis protein CapA [Enhygromyxa salina]
MLALFVTLGCSCQKPSPADDGAVEPSPTAPLAAAEALLADPDADADADPDVPSDEAGLEAVVEPEPPWTLPDDYLRFDGACEPGRRVTLAFGGDLLLHRELQIQAYASKQGAAVLWAGIADLLAEPDLTYLNLEGPLAHGLDRDFLEVEDPGRAFDRLVYTGYPRFNYHASIAKDLVAAGVDIVSTANNHALDRGPVGVERTIAALRKAKLAFVGTRESDMLERLYTVTEVEGLKIAWIACTNSTNRVPDDLDQVLQCGSGTAVEGVIRRLRATGRYKKREPKVDAVIVTPHWGKEYVHTPRERERKLARRWVEAGALAVVGSHPHVVQPWAKLEAEDGREGLVLYSLGNFASHQPELSRRTSLLLYLTLVETEDGELHIAGVRHLPLHVRQAGDEFFVEAIDRLQGSAPGQAPGSVQGQAPGAADARALIVALLGAGNLVLPDEPKLGDPHCDEDWRPHEIPAWARLAEPFVVPGTEDEDEGETEGEPSAGDPR